GLRTGAAAGIVFLTSAGGAAAPGHRADPDRPDGARVCEAVHFHLRTASIHGRIHGAVLNLLDRAAHRATRRLSRGAYSPAAMALRTGSRADTGMGPS